MTEEPLLTVRDLKKHYPLKAGLLNRQVGAARAVDGISFDIYPGETLGLVGESGCGKSTAATSIMRLEEPTEGEVIFNGGGRAGATRNADGSHPNDITGFNRKELKKFRRHAQMIFQDPASSFNPRMTVGSAVAEMLLVHGMTDKERRRTIVQNLLERVGLSAEDYDRYPHEFSGGQKQRVALARALVLNPDFIVADEPVSALDVSIKAEVLSLMNELQEEFGLAMLFISHDMSTIAKVCDRVAVMYLGEIVEIGETETLFENPQHPYTEALLSAIPTPDPRTRSEGIELKGTVPSPTNPPSGCRFHTRCHRVIQPSSVDIEQEDWRALLNFRDRVQMGAIDLESIRENALGAVDSETTVEASELKTQIRTEFDLPEQLADTDADTTLDEALDVLANDNVEDAVELLTTKFVTPCEETKPQYTEHSTDHRSACLLHEDADASVELVADDD